MAVWRKGLEVAKLQEIPCDVGVPPTILFHLIMFLKKSLSLRAQIHSLIVRPRTCVFGIDFTGLPFANETGPFDIKQIRVPL